VAVTGRCGSRVYVSKALAPIVSDKSFSKKRATKESVARAFRMTTGEFASTSWFQPKPPLSWKHCCDLEVAVSDKSEMNESPPTLWRVICCMRSQKNESTRQMTIKRRQPT
jgi:hypothetical protein